MVKVGYVRVSKENQDPASQQKLMKEMGILDCDVFIDHGFSGWSDPTVRPTYKEMLKRLSAPDKEKVDTIVFSEFSRLGRNVNESMYELLRLQHSGITLQSLSQLESFINNVPMPWQLQIITGIMIGADIERKHHIERTRWGLENVRDKGSKSGKPMGRPVVKIDFKKIKELQDQHKVSENVARKILGYSASTFYSAKKKQSG